MCGRTRFGSIPGMDGVRLARILIPALLTAGGACREVSFVNPDAAGTAHKITAKPAPGQPPVPSGAKGAPAAVVSDKPKTPPQIGRAHV